ncbi:hypothetical protein BDN70DRAFT_991740 [Pholiota conissans]|uniref:Uncharacterized protein n=1 Tax=Pholiota conissans TaxID=109636 RepID=A0A9P5Z8X7_9AGAR|nr:hypothetical protein BDN70DRAFT_991740 [Pholiota conissans]
MLSSFASFLPSALHLNPSPELPRPTVNPDTEDEDEREPNPPPRTSESEAHQGKGKEKDKTANETFIFVRPPPSKSNHPLNLQVQLVPPNAKPPTGVVSSSNADGMSTTPTSATSSRSSSDGMSLARTSSGRSESSSSNIYSASTASFTSVASSTASSTTRRNIIPLYNLQAHNVMTNVIVDAGTDAKIAKFQRRGIELIDLAFLEPVEVWGEKDKERDARRESMRISVDEMGAIIANLGSRGSIKSARLGGSFLQPNAGSRPVTPSAASSAASLHSNSHSNLKANAKPELVTVKAPAPLFGGQSEITPSISTTPTPTVIPNPPKRNIFNKLFKKNSAAATSPTGMSGSETSSMNSFGAFSLHPAPVTNKIFARDKDSDRRRARGPPPALPLLQPPTSPTSTSSQQTTPTAPQTPRAQAHVEPVSPTPTIAPSKEKTHGRNASLTSAITTPFKTTLRNNRNRLSAVVHGNIGGGPAESDRESTSSRTKDERRLLVPPPRDASPNPSMTRSNRSQQSLTSSAAHGIEYSEGAAGNQGYPLMLTQSQTRDELTNLKQQQLQLRPPILGIQPTFVSSVPSSGAPSASGMTSPLVAVLGPRVENPENVLHGQRALMYVWLVRRWLKRRPSAFGDAGIFGRGAKSLQPPNLANGGHSQENSGSAGPPPLLYGGVEVRFEWKRARGKERGSKSVRRSRRSRGGGADDGGAAESDDGGSVRNRDRTRDRTREREAAPLDGRERVKIEERRQKRMSTGSFSTTTASEEGDGSLGGRRLHREMTVDEGDESDPEDSETPWVCTLKIRRSAAAANNPSNAPQVLRVKVGTLSPTPHHPKVVAMLKVPFPLPDVEVERMGVIRRKGFPIPGEQPPTPQMGSFEDHPREPYNGITLTAEEIKDMVCSTGLWLVVREGFGGVGRVSRKGDGWRLRG